jgi:hypothetical protein
MNYDADSGIAMAWGLDLVRAINEHNKFRRFLIRLALGKYAWRELVGLKTCLKDARLYPEFKYGLEGCKYHNEKVAW